MDKNKMKRIDNPKRLEDYNIEKIMKLLGIKPHEVVLDVGAGTGVFSLAIANELSSGLLIALEIQSELIDIINEKIDNSRINNIKPILADELKIEENSVDKVFVCAVLHEIEDKIDFVSQYKNALKDDGKIFIIEFYSGKRSIEDKDNPNRIFMPVEDTINVLEKSGFCNIKKEHLSEIVYMVIGDK